MKEKYSKCSVKYISSSRWITSFYITWFFENKLPRAIYKENYKTKYLRLFTPFPNLITKESYNWWLTRRIWGFIQQKSDGKYLPMSVANIGKHYGPFRKRKWCLRDFVDTQKGLRNHFATKGYSRRAAKLASTLRFPAPFSRHGSCIVRRRNTLLYKSVAKFSQQKADSATL